jgi:hypothetical protein
MKAISTTGEASASVIYGANNWIKLCSQLLCGLLFKIAPGKIIRYLRSIRMQPVDEMASLETA